MNKETIVPALVSRKLAVISLLLSSIGCILVFIPIVDIALGYPLLSTVLLRILGILSLTAGVPALITGLCTGIFALKRDKATKRASVISIIIAILGLVIPIAFYAISFSIASYAMYD